MTVRGSHLKNPLHDQLAQYAARFAQPVFFGDWPDTVGQRISANGAGCFVRLREKIVGITCQHVLAGYRRHRTAGSAAAFQFGPVRLDPEKHLISESQVLDLATFDMSSFRDGPQQVESSICIHPVTWPPADVTRDDVLAFALNAVDAHGPHHIMTRLVLDECDVAVADGLQLGPIGGLSGGPVFAWRQGLILLAELVGIVSEYVTDWGLLRVSRLACVGPEGRIELG